MDLKKIGKRKGKFENTKLQEIKKEKTLFESRAETLFELAKLNSIKNRLLVFSLIVIFGLCGVISFFALRKNDRIFLVQVDKQTGAVVDTDIITKSTAEVGENEKRYFISKFILDVRTIPSDMNFYNNKLKDLSLFLTNASQNKVNNMLEETGIVQNIRDRITSTVNIVSVNKLNQENVYQVRWKEDFFGADGEKGNTNSYIGIFTIDFIQQDDVRKILKNPLGLIIKDFSISQENN